MTRKQRQALLCLIAASPLFLAQVARAESEPSNTPAELAEAWAEYKAAVRAGDIDRRLVAAQAAASAAEELLDPDDPRLPLFILKYGDALLQKRRLDEAAEVLGKALNVAESIHGKDSVELLDILASLADASSDVFKKGKQLAVYRRALKIAESANGKSSEIYARLAMRAAVNSYSLSRTTKGRRYLEEAHKYFAAQNGEEDYDTAVALFYLGKFAFSDRKRAAAIDYLQAALPGLQQSQGNGALDMQLFARTLLARVYQSAKKNDLATQQYIEIGRLSERRPKTDYLPLLRVAPVYPVAMLKKRNEGYVDLQFTVDASGRTRDIVVIGRGENDGGFEKAAIDAVKKFRYAPRFVDGEPVSAEGIKTRITFRME